MLRNGLFLALLSEASYTRGQGMRLSEIFPACEGWVDPVGAWGLL